ncbi:MAG: hypothetical protein C0514_06440 [Candidatus Puniceispirillum sp.]|nr:hypothetical protein [Candidatus Puniceispirillum sp.]
MTLLSLFLRSLFVASLFAGCEGYARPSPELWNVPVSHAPFWGRKAQLIELEQKLTKEPVVVTGLSGMGKSRLAFTYAKKQAHKYRIVWVFDASQGMDNQMINFANKLHAVNNKGEKGSFSNKEDATHYVKTLLRTCTFSWLLIFDGTASFAHAKDSLPETHGATDKHVIMTSLSDKGASGVLQLDALSDQEAFALLSHYLKDASSQDIARLAKTLHNHPLAMVQASAYINATPGMGVDAYIAFFTKSKNDYWASEAKALQGQPLLFTTIKMSVEKLKAASPQDYTLLVALCMLDTHKIERPLIEQAYVNLTNGDMAGFGKITDVALISKASPDTYAVHDYVRDVVLNTADKDTLKAAAALTAQVLLKRFPEKIEDCIAVFEKNPRLHRHTKMAFEHADYMPAKDALNLGIRLFYFSERRNHDFDFAVPNKKKMKDIFEKQPNADPLIAGIFFENYGYTVLTGGTIDDTIVELKKSYAFFKKADPEAARPHMIALLVDGLGFFNHWKGDIETAQRHLEEAKALLRKGDDPYFYVSVHQLEAVLTQDRGSFQAAINTLDTSKPFFEANDSLRSASWPFSSSLKACSLVKLGRYAEAKRLSEEAIEVALKHADGDEGIDQIGRLYVYLSQAQSGLGQHKVAQENALKAIDIMNKSYGEAVIRRQGVAHIALGDALVGQGKFAEAEAAYRSAQDIFDAISTHKAFDDMSEVLYKMFILGKKQEGTPQGNVLMIHAMDNHRALFEKLHPRFIAMTRMSLDLPA